MASEENCGNKSGDQDERENDYFCHKQGVLCVEITGFSYPKPKCKSDEKSENRTDIKNDMYLCKVNSIFLSD